MSKPEIPGLSVQARAATLLNRSASTQVNARIVSIGTAVPGPAVPQERLQSFFADQPGASKLTKRLISAVDHDDRLLLGSAHRRESSRFSTFAGFVEAGESLEDAVVREVQEEAGIVIEQVKYAGSQPWPFPRSLMVGFFAHTSNTDAIADDEEIREVRWFTRQQLHDQVVSGAVKLPPRSSVSHALIASWYGGTLPEAA